MSVRDLPASVVTALRDPAYRRADPEGVAAALAALGCPGSGTFRSFFDTYAGPFAGAGGFELLDLVDRTENIVTQTMVCRMEHQFDNRHLVITNLLGNGVLVYDCESDAVFEVDFEGADHALSVGALQPRWHSFADSLVDFFA